MVPWWAISNFPGCPSVLAPVNAPRSYPNSSLSASSSGIAAQLTVTKGPFARPPSSWIAWAKSSFPVPVSPRMRMFPSLRPYILADDTGEGGARPAVRYVSARWIARVPGGGAPRGVIHRGRLREPREKDLVADHVGEGDGQVQEVLPEFLGDVGVEELRDIHASEEIPVFVENRRSGAERRGYVFV